MKKRHKWILPFSNWFNLSDQQEETEVVGNAPCPCCGFITIPNAPNEAQCYICPVCFWEIDLCIQSEEEPSDQNHGLSLSKARKNYVKYGATMPELKVHCRSPKESEIPKK